ncbi:MAG: hypothetical protein WCV93_01160 [Candidatus Shapirobacteria bacterium]
MDNNTPAQKRFVSYLRKRDPGLSETDIAKLLGDMKRFVKVIKKVYTEPQARIYYRERLVGEKIHKDRVVETDLQEVMKLVDRSVNKPKDLLLLGRKLYKAVNDDIHKRR